MSKQKEVEINVNEKDINKEELNGQTSKTNKNRNKRSRSNNRNKQNKKDSTRKGSYKSNPNPADLYNRVSSLSGLATRLNFYNPLGGFIDLNTPNSLNYPVNSIAGVMSISFIPTMGSVTENDNQNPANIAWNKLLAYCQSTVSRTLEFDPADLGLYMMAWDNVYMWYTSLVRVYATILKYSFGGVDRYAPNYLVDAQGFDYDDLSVHQADLQYFINRLAYTISQYNVPAGYPFIERHQWLVSGIYSDANTAKPQSYIFKPDMIFMYQEADGAGKLVPANAVWKTSGKTFEDIKTITTTMLNTLLNSQDFWNISALLLRAFGRENMLQCIPIENSLSVLETSYRPEVLLQINNMTILPDIDFTDSATYDAWSVRQGELSTGSREGALYQPCMIINTAPSAGKNAQTEYYLQNRILNLMEVSDDNIIEAVRCMAIAREYTVSTTPNEGVLVWDSFGTELITRINLYFRQWSGRSEVAIKNLPIHSYLNFDVTNPSNTLMAASALSTTV